MSDDCNEVLPRVTIVHDCRRSEERAARRIMYALQRGKPPPKRSAWLLRIFRWVAFILLVGLYAWLQTHQRVRMAPATSPLAQNKTIDLTEMPVDIGIAATVLFGCALLFVAGLFTVGGARGMDQKRWKKDEVHFTFSDEGLLRERPGKSEFYGWQSLAGYNDALDMLLVRLSPNYGFPFPKRLFTDPEDLKFVSVLLDEKLSSRPRGKVGFEVITHETDV